MFLKPTTIYNQLFSSSKVQGSVAFLGVLLIASLEGGRWLLALDLHQGQIIGALGRRLGHHAGVVDLALRMQNGMQICR